jgi:flagellar biosynthesis protein FlhF
LLLFLLQEELGVGVIIKKYIGKTKEEAEEKAKTELGEGYCVLYTRQIKKRLLGILNGKQIEITVAMENDKTKEDEVSKISISHRSPVTIVNVSHKSPAHDMQLPNKEETVNTVEELVQITDPRISVDDNASKRSFETTEDRPGENKCGKSQDAYQFVKVLYTNLLKSEVDERYINELTSMVEFRYSSQAALDRMLKDIYEKMILKCGKPCPIDCDKTSHRLEIFIGPTGVGKTTTIAKIAAQLIISQKKVLLATSDTYRIGAAEQLGIFAARMGTPFITIFSSEDLLRALDEFSEYDYILLDTTGHNFRNKGMRQKMYSIIGPAKDTVDHDIYLVLSATTSYKELIEIADSYAEDYNYKIIYTKIDEKPVLGNLYNLRIHTQADIAYLTYGQIVPNDICTFDPQGLVKSLLGAIGYAPSEIAEGIDCEETNDEEL